VQLGTQKGLANVRYVLDKNGSRFTVQAFATGLLSAFGHSPTIAIRDFDGEVDFVPDTYEKATLRVTVRTATFELLDEMKRDDREKLQRDMFDKVLEVDQFPTAVYESRQINVQKLGEHLLQAQVAGDLTLHGVTEPLAFDARVQNSGTLLRVSGEFSLQQSNYDIKPVSIAGGTLRLKDQLKFRFEVVARPAS
jgi:polyisoprenoid-binding protein YceI